jgi:hypothetical protein
MLKRTSRVVAGAVLSSLALPLGTAGAQDQVPPTIEELLKDGWTVAGYAAQGTTYILLRHEGLHYLVQCSVLYDTTRGAKTADRVRTNCYELH